ncbi:RIP metalloprotease RseP [Candidatus Shapirobacteria bacterium]|nr:RIP metalloprotease RseP [Candidatus Shapirobacteria bacterium]
MFITILTALVVLSVLILVHELGHFLAAKKAGIKVEEFGLGFPPRAWGKKIGGTIYSVNWLPFGGFVRLYGEDLEESQKLKDKKGAFWQKSKKARATVITAGVLSNFLLAVLIFSVVYSYLGIPTKTDQIKVVEVFPNSPAAKAGLKSQDIIFKIDDEVLTETDVFIKKIDEKKGQTVNLGVKRQDEELFLTLNPRREPPEGEGPLGVLIANVEMKKYPFWQMPVRSTIEGTKEAVAWLVLIVKGLGKMMADLFTQGVVPKDVAGPVGIFQITGMVAKSGFLNVLQFAGFLSINLAVINILPFPALDGGRLVFIIYEVVARRKPKPAIERWVNTAGMALLLCLIFLLTLNDLKRLLGWENFNQFWQKIWPF